MTRIDAPIFLSDVRRADSYLPRRSGHSSTPRLAQRPRMRDSGLDYPFYSKEKSFASRRRKTAGAKVAPSRKQYMRFVGLLQGHPWRLAGGAADSRFQRIYTRRETAPQLLFACRLITMGSNPLKAQALLRPVCLLPGGPYLRRTRYPCLKCPACSFGCC